MREFVVILAVIGLLLALTAVRYRKQIAGMLQVYRMLRSTRERMKNVGAQTQPTTSSKLVSCAKCGTWTPEASAIRMGPSIYYCSRECAGQAVKAN